MIDASELKYLDAQQQSELRAFEQLFESQGWEYVKEMLEGSMESVESGIVEATSWDQARYLKGKLDALRMLAQLPDYIEQDATSAALQGRAEQQQQLVDAEFEYE